MISKSELKKRFILEKSKEVFIEKGYKMVTMTDIVKICKISRGGLYRYYKDTSEIFLEILSTEQQKIGTGFSDAISKDKSSITILEFFLQEQKEHIFKRDQSLTGAIYEFFSINKYRFEDDIMKNQFERGVKILTELIQYGIDRKEFKAVDKNIIAKNIILTLEGIKVSSEVMTISEDLVDEQFEFIKSTLLNEAVKG